MFRMFSSGAAAASAAIAVRTTDIAERVAWSELQEIVDEFQAVAESYVPYDTGDLIGSFTQFDYPEHLHIVFTAGEGLRYARFVEEGTGWMAPRPYIAPAEAHVLAKLNSSSFGADVISRHLGSMGGGPIGRGPRGHAGTGVVHGS